MSDFPFTTVGTADSEVVPDYLCDGTDDQIVIQAAIDSIAAIPQVIIRHPDGSPYSGLGSRGTIVLLRGAYAISDTITLKGNVHLKLTDNAVLYPMVDVDLIIIKKGAGISGGSITAAAMNTGYTHNFLRVNGSEQIFGENFIRDMILTGGPGCTGTAIYYDCTQFYTEFADMGSIYGARVSGIDMANFEYGIKLENNNGSWAAGNFFNNINIAGVQYGIYLKRGPDGVALGPYNNMFAGINIEMGVGVPSSSIGVYCAGTQNVFDPIILWDTAPNDSVVFADTSSSNTIVGRLEENITDLGTNNNIINYKYPLGTKISDTLTLTTLPSTAMFPVALETAISGTKNAHIPAALLQTLIKGGAL